MVKLSFVIGMTVMSVSFVMVALFIEVLVISMTFVMAVVCHLLEQDLSFQWHRL